VSRPVIMPEAASKEPGTVLCRIPATSTPINIKRLAPIAVRTSPVRYVPRLLARGLSNADYRHSLPG
jgi:hypothetical protein